MPTINQVEAVFHDALGLPEGADRAAWLGRRCGDDAELKAEVSSLLAAHDAMATQPEPAEANPEPVVPSEHFGAYRLVRLVGRGGMSVVYLARAGGRTVRQTRRGKSDGGTFGRRRFSAALPD